MGFHSLVFEFLNVAIMPLWFGLLFFPERKWVTLSIDIFVALAATLFVINLVPGLVDALPVIVKPSLTSVSQLISTPAGTLGSWTHFVISDLWVGRWISEDGDRQGISHFIVFPILVVTLLFGPVGLLLYFIVKLITRRRFGCESC